MQAHIVVVVVSVSNNRLQKKPLFFLMEFDALINMRLVFDTYTGNNTNTDLNLHLFLSYCSHNIIEVVPGGGAVHN